jgi:tRNA A37 threonylcarbamoyladenosine dehydratase
MGTGNKLDPTRLLVADIYETSVCPLARVMRHELRKRGIEKLKVVYSKEEPRKLSAQSEEVSHKPVPAAFHLYRLLPD